MSTTDTDTDIDPWSSALDQLKDWIRKGLMRSCG